MGPGTVEALRVAGCSALALEAGQTVLIDRELWAAAADDAGLAIEGV